MSETQFQINPNQLNQDPSPHVFAKPSSQWIMLQVIIALLFPTAAGIYFFGWRVLLMLTVGIVTAVVSEYAFQKYKRRKTTVSDLSAVVTGMLLSLSLPVTAPLWTIVIGSAFAILVVKQLPGGIGRNVFNPAVAARVMLKAFFSPWITNWVLPGPDLVTTATPLEYIGNFTQTVSSEVPSLWNLFLGVDVGGPVGETSKIMILLGIIYLVVRKIISPNIPILYLLSLAFVTTIYGDFSFQYFMTHILSGTAFFAAAYMVTDYSSQPITSKGKLLFAIGAGLLTGIIRIVFDFPGGVGFSILIMNALSPWIDKHTAPRIYGHDKPIENNNPLRERVILK